MSERIEIKLYRINYGENNWEDLGVVSEEGESLGVLVEVLPCEHGNYAEHVDEDEGIWADGDRIHVIQCDGKPKEDS